MASYESVLDSIGATPLLRLTRAAQGLRPRVYVKPEWQNPGGSVKDRAALAMLRRAEAEGALRPGGTVVEVTSGNTGIGLALAAAHLGYRAVIFTSSTIAREKRAQLTAYGAELRLVDAFVPKDHPDSVHAQGQRFAEETPGAWLAHQYDNPANPAAHYATTGPEIWADTDGAVTHFVATVGTGGTISGTGRYLKEVSGGRVRVTGADPLTSAYSGGDGSQKYIEGAGHFVHPEAARDLWPRSLDTGVIDDYAPVDDQSAIDAIRRLARTEGILAGGSSGVALAAALRLAEHLTEEDTVVVLLPDSGRAYLSTYFDDDWLAANGFTAPTAEGGPGEPTVGAHATATPDVEADESAADAVRRLTAAGVADDDVVLVVHRRAGRVLALHPSDVIGWTTPARLRGAATVAGAARRLGPRLGGRLALTAPAVTAWAATDGEVALVLDRGRVAGTVTRRRLRRDPAHRTAGHAG
ncbi:cysteine synthase family protein [Streptomyces seoulensis]|nr:cysteine synthase family protein [Streptomyces seoulensis]